MRRPSKWETSLIDPAVGQRIVAVRWSVVLSIALLGGCGDGRPDRIQVSGRVTFDGDGCPAGGRLVFAATEAAPGFPMRPGHANFEADGNYRAMTWTEGDGLMPGSYLVAIECWKVKPAFKVAGVSHVPAKYMHPRTSGLELDVAAGSDDIEKNFDIPLIPKSQP